MRTGKLLNNPAQHIRRTVNNNVPASESPRGSELYRIGHGVLVSGKPYYAHPQYPVYDQSVTDRIALTRVGDGELRIAAVAVRVLGQVELLAAARAMRTRVVLGAHAPVAAVAGVEERKRDAIALERRALLRVPGREQPVDEGGPTSAQIGEVAGELTNMICGAALSRIESNSTESQDYQNHKMRTITGKWACGWSARRNGVR